MWQIFCAFLQVLLQPYSLTVHQDENTRLLIPDTCTHTEATCPLLTPSCLLFPPVLPSPADLSVGGRGFLHSSTQNCLRTPSHPASSLMLPKLDRQSEWGPSPSRSLYRCSPLPEELRVLCVYIEGDFSRATQTFRTATTLPCASLSTSPANTWHTSYPMADFFIISPPRA